MKKVVDRHTVAHLWANKAQSEARTARGNFFFNDDRIWSYGSHFLIAYHTHNDRGQHAVVITRSRYSNTTAEQVGIVRSASGHLKQLTVPEAGMDNRQLFEKWYDEITGIAGKLGNARKPEKYIAQIRGIMAEATAYVEFFGIEMPERMVEAGKIQSSEQFAAMLAKEAELTKTAFEKRRAAENKAHKSQLKDWRAFKTAYIKTRDGYDYLRFNHTTKRVQTSQRVEIPEAIAREFYNLVLQTIASGGCADCRISLMEKYEVAEINKDFIKVGCHKITLKEIRSFTRKLGW
ncbi:hypothetical protein SAMN05192574_105334 [Mucilaginibacter gossypiicola]|uniref:Uncharacterized protein n=1 Tax=Mucilaginibacter gossypiicola TaxID=551995 RepID=A0A1H8M0N6_9SPHI|nr:hypothetical protein [Mucilaginibacter gossypiicola]SEO10869.1 hypothetical protein SAMN05192574_105334 [Mucilaginibacter gossypiicola]